MSIRNKVLAAGVTLALAGVPVAVAGTAGAATPSCGSGTHNGGCVDIFSRDFGTHQTPGFVLDIFRQGAKVGQPAILFRTSNSDPAEDVSWSLQGKVSDLYAAGLVSSAFALHYGCAGSVPVAGVQIPCGPAAADDYAFELEYSPFGVNSGLCVGVAQTAFSGEKVTLQSCGSSGRTIWAIDQADASSTQPALDEYVPLINGSDTNFSDPFVLTYPKAGFPTDRPRPQLQVQNLTGFTQAGNGDPSGVNSNQLWGADLGVLK